jgi:hypothetical protein
MVGLKMAKYNGSGWHFQHTRHSNARKYGKAGGTYVLRKKKYLVPPPAGSHEFLGGYEMVKKQPEREYGFDLTGFKSAEDFEALLKAHGLTKHKRIFHPLWHKGEKFYKKGDGYTVFSWSNPEGTLELRTGNNPITGEYNMPKQRAKEKGYASYMGIKGDNDKVVILADDIKRRATEIKDEDPKHNGFIW